MTPTPTGIEAAVCADIAQRQAKGIAKYGTTVADNPLPLRDWLQHAYEETLDKAVYLKRAIAEIDNDEAPRWLPVRRHLPRHGAMCTCAQGSPRCAACPTRTDRQ